MANTKKTTETKTPAQKKAANTEALKADAAKKAAGSEDGATAPGENQGEGGTDQSDPAKVPATEPGTVKKETLEEVQERNEAENEKARKQFGEDGLQKLKTREEGGDPNFTKHQALGSKSQQVI